MGKIFALWKRECPKKIKRFDRDYFLPAAYKMALENLKSLGLEGPHTIHIEFVVVAARDVYPNSKIV